MLLWAYCSFCTVFIEFTEPISDCFKKKGNEKNAGYIIFNSCVICCVPQ